MNDDVYVDIRKRLNRFDRKLANVPSAMEMLKMIYTPEDAQFCAEFPEGVSTARELSDFYGYTESEMEIRMEDLIKKNVVFTTVDQENIKRYELMPWVPGVFEVSVVTHKGTPWLKRFDLLYLQYEKESDAKLDKFGGDKEAIKAVMPEPDVRTLPVNVSLPAEGASAVYDYENVVDLVSKQTAFAAMRCTCRTLSEHRGTPCKSGIPEYSCLQFGKAARHAIEYGYGRKITKEECLGIIKAAAEAGAVHNVNNFTEALQFVCNCCPDCCGFLKGIKRMGNIKMITPSNFIPLLTGENCTGCALCSERCPVNAIAVDEIASIDKEACIGCGNCVAACPTEALGMERRSEFKPTLGNRKIGMGF